MPGSFRPCGDLNVAHSKQILIHSGGDLSLSVVFADLPLALFSVLGGNVFHYWRRNMNGSFVGWSSRWFGQVFESPPRPPGLHIPKLSLSYSFTHSCSLYTAIIHSFTLYVKIYLYLFLYFCLFLSFFDHRK